MVPILIANWKMHFSLTHAINVCNKLMAHQCEKLMIAPPIPYLAFLAATFPNITFCAQNLSEFIIDGAYTGEYSGSMLKSCGINYSIVGHSERRTLFNDTNAIIAAKVNACLKADITPVICIGESAQNRQDGYHKQVLIEQLESFILNDIDDEIIIAYEPIWSIGTNRLPTKLELTETFEAINSYLAQTRVAKNARLLYGGSVNLDNIEQILSIDHVNGVLVGKSSLDPAILIEMLNRLY
jgi:triosephosphate isomerase (TIM)